MLVWHLPTDGSIGPPFINGEPLRAAAQPKSTVNGDYHTVVKAAVTATRVASVPGPPTIDKPTGKPSTVNSDCCHFNKSAQLDQPLPP
jgi:hypothetical protein